MLKITFQTAAAGRIYDDYMKRVDKSIKILSPDDKSELLMELNSHIYEGLAKNIDKSEVDTLLDITEKLGTPEEFLQPLVASKKMSQAVTSFNPKVIYQAIKLNIRHGIVYSFFAILYLLLFCFGFLIIVKIFFPDHTGLFYINNEFSSFGFLMDTSGQTEIMGYWLIPAALIAAFIFYVCITLLLRVFRK